MNKTQGKLSDFAYVRQDGSRTVIGYGLQQIAGSEDYEWFEVYLYRRQHPSISFNDVKSAILADINARIKEKIIQGFEWEGMPVWLSEENQMNFSQAVVPVTLKIGEQEDGDPVYHTFETEAELQAFNQAWIAYRQQQLSDGWAEKDAIDWGVYNIM